MTYRASRGRRESDRTRKFLRHYRREDAGAFTRVKALWEELRRKAALDREERISFVAGNMAIDDPQGRSIEFWREKATAAVDAAYLEKARAMNPSQFYGKFGLTKDSDSSAANAEACKSNPPKP